MDKQNMTVLLITLCLAGAAAVVISEWRDWRVVRVLSKAAASTAFASLAAVNGAADSTYGRLILIALILSWAGDILLLSLRSVFLMGGMAAFLLAHGAFGAAFLTLPFDKTWTLISLAVLTAAGLLILRWLWRYLETLYRVAVPAYLAATTVMTSLAIAVSIASTSPLLAIAALSFAASDVSVARDRFIAHAVVNKAWGLPLYYFAQILFAMSVCSYR
jgi:uncharacterized membrane protein YhhN